MDTRMKELRLKKGLTLKELGKILNVKDNTLSQYETGKRNPQINFLKEFADFFNVSLDYLLKNNDFKMPNVGYRIKKLRTSKNLNKKALADKLGTSESVIDSWEYGAETPSAVFLDKLATFFNVSLDYLKYGTLQDYLISVVIKDFDSENSVVKDDLIEYLKLTTNYASFANGIPFVDNKPVSPEDYPKYLHDKTIEIIYYELEDKFDDLKKYLNSVLRYGNDQEILLMIDSWLRNECFIAANSFIGAARSMDDSIEQKIPIASGYENKTVEQLKEIPAFKDKSNEYLLDLIYRCKLADISLKFSIDLQKMIKEYQTELSRYSNVHNQPGRE